MKLELIAPKRIVTDKHRDHWDGKTLSFIMGIKRYGYAHLALATLASLTPQDVEVKVTDENIEDIDFDKDVDLVGITATTFMAPSAYKIADEFRRRGVKVVLGGIHPSMLPGEALQHADAVVVGEAENVWARLIYDYKNNRLKKIYKSEERPELGNQPLPQWDFLKNEK